MSCQLKTVWDTEQIIAKLRPANTNNQVICAFLNVIHATLVKLVYECKIQAFFIHTRRSFHRDPYVFEKPELHLNYYVYVSLAKVNAIKSICLWMDIRYIFI